MNAVAPAYSFDRRKTGGKRAERRARLSWTLVREIRQWSRREGYGLALKDQVTALQTSYPISRRALEQILENTTWFDPAYERGSMDNDYWRGSNVAHVVLSVLRRVSS